MFCHVFVQEIQATTADNRDDVSRDNSLSILTPTADNNATLNYHLREFDVVLKSVMANDPSCEPLPQNIESKTGKGINSFEVAGTFNSAATAISNLSNCKTNAALSAGNTRTINAIKNETTITDTIVDDKVMTMKEKAEQRLRAQRAAHQLKTGSISPAVGTPEKIQIVPLDSKIQTTNRIHTPQGNIIIRPMMAGQQFIVTPDGKRQLLGAAPAAGNPILIAPSPIRPVGTPAAASSMSSKLQITRGADGKIQIRGLQPGQQLVRRADGQFSIVTTSPATSAALPVQQPVSSQQQPALSSPPMKKE